ALLSTDLELDASQILTYYAKRWSIEVFFKDAKQMLYMGREQSKTFDAAIASYSIVMIRYLLLVYLMNKRTVANTIGTIFRDVVDEQQMLLYSEKIWNIVKEQLFKSIKLLSYKIELDILYQLFDLIDDILFNQVRLITAKV
ncbi:MAG: transposase, partial [Desulfamplus sp.]|nr:transposase [Desulfamplus sp.]